MTPRDFTFLIGVDNEHIKEARVTVPRLLRHRKQASECRCIFLCDDYQQEMDVWQEVVREIWPDAIVCPVSRLLPELVRWVRDTVSQREIMLSALVHAVHLVKTPWFIKLDTDTLSLAPGSMWEDDWFSDRPVYVSSPWGYTVPSNALDVLDNWGDGVPGLKEHPRLNVPFNPASRIVKSPRIISWLYFGRTDWHRQVSQACYGYGPDSRLPVASQDTIAYYFAERTNAPRKRVRLARCGWAHVHGLRKLKEIAGRVV